MESKTVWGNRLRENLGNAFAASLEEEQEPSLGGGVSREQTTGQGCEEKMEPTPLPAVSDSVTLDQDRSMMHSLFSDAAETWIKGQVSNGSDVPEGQEMQPSSFEESSHDYEADEDNDSDSSLDTPTKSHSKTVTVSLDADDTFPVNVSMASTEDRGFAHRQSFETTTSLATSSSASFGSIDSVEVEMAAELHASWTTMKSSSETSSSFSSLGGSAEVYVKDDEYCWLPATVLEYRKECALVTVKLPETWNDSTFVEDKYAGVLPKLSGIHSTMKGMSSSDIDILASEYDVLASSLRQVFYKDYEHGDLPKQNTQASGRRNMEDLFHQHPAAILYNLKERHYFQKPYTRVGDILIALNPFVWIDRLYLPETRDLYSRHIIWEASHEAQVNEADLKEKQNIYDRLGFDPHVYEVSSMAYRGLARTNQDQTILVTGESGAGKTETVKLLLDHLATVQLTRPEGVHSEHCASKDIVDRVIKSSPVFEAFGNAKTVRNSNSSRFGKFIQLQFRVEPSAIAKLGGREVPYTDMVGSKVSTYLLEKNRVVSHSDGERSFHIFYQLLAAPEEFKEQLWPFFGQSKVENFKYTSGKDTQNEEDAELWEETTVALGLFKFRNDSLVVLMQALGIVLQLGNLIFKEDTTVEHDHSTVISSIEELNRLAEMTGIAQDELHEMMTSRTLKTPGADVISVKLAPEAAKEACDALAKEIYSKIFEVIVNRINESTMQHKQLECKVTSTLGHISLLDVFGFEHFETNRFEQLCINYTNEKLQHKFVVDNFNEIKTEYIEEGVDMFDFKLVDNSETLHLLEGRHGLIVALNEECMLPKGNDESFVSKAKKSNSGSKKMISKKLHLPHEFAVEHFAGTVQYDAKSFVQTNMDKLPENLIRCASRSSNSLISDEFKKIITSCKVHGDGSKSSIRKKKVNNKTVLHKFQHQLKDLITTMEGTRTRYIRCIKANSPMIPKLTDHVSTMKQLECSGLMTALIISKESFPQKLTYDFILSRYACLLQNDRLKDAVAGMGAQEKVKYVLMRWLKPLSTKNRDGTRTMPFACGKTKVFFKPGAQDHLEYLRRQFYERSSLTIQSWFRRIAAKRHVVLRKQSMYKIQSFCRMALARLRIENQKKASTFICAWIRCRWALLAFQLKRDKATTIQSEVRRWREEKKYTKMRGSALLVQATIRMLLTRLQSQRLKDASGVINTWIYRCVFHMKLKRSLAAKMIQRHWRACRCQRNLRDSVSGALIIQKTWQAHVSRKKVLSEKHLQHDCTSRNLPMALGDDGSDFCSDDSDVVSSSYSTLNSMNATNFRSMKPDVASEKQHSEATYNGRLTDAEISGMMEKMKQSKVKEQLQLAEIEQLQVTFKRRVADLTKANNGLVKEVFKLRQECDKAKKQQRMDALQMNSKLEAIEEDKERLRRKYEKKIQSLERRLFENEEQHVEEKKAKDRDVRVLEAKYSDSVATLREELKKTQDSHQKYLAKLMTILETTQSMREKETAKITGELRAIKKEKDGQILMLQQELNAARAAKGIVVSSVAPKMMIDSPRMKKELLSDADRMVECSQKFNDAVEQLTNLITSSHVLPPVVGPHNMAEVLEQQENAQRMMELIGVLMDLYSIGEERQASTNEQALTAVNDYIALSEPDEAIRDLRERLAQVELENARIRQELREKEHCRKCAIREEAARRRIEWSGY